MRNPFVAILAVLLLLLAACAPAAQPDAAAPSAPPPAPEPAAQPPLVGPALEVLEAAKILPTDRKVFSVTLDGGRARSAYGSRLADGAFGFELSEGDVLKVSVPYGQPVVTLAGGDITLSVGPGEFARIEMKRAGSHRLSVSANGQKTDELLLAVGERLPAVAPAPPAAPPAPVSSVQEFTVEADDNGLYPAELEVFKGDTVRITFKVREENVYYGGLDFRSGVFTTETVAPGGETTVEFVADGSFGYSSYWPTSSVKKADGYVSVKTKVIVS